jgi:hypothetical protein
MNRWIAKRLPWYLSVLAVLGMFFMLASCGREAPVYQPGNILVTSTPPGATIYLDGVETDLVTPATLEGLAPDNYVISVELEGFLVDPVAQTAVVSPLRTTELGAFNLSATSLAVTSSPEGAAIFLDGEDTGQVTPATLVGVPEGNVEITLALPGYLVSPTAFTASVIAGQANQVPEDTFVLRATHTVLFEGFSNVSCLGCGDLAINMDALMHRPGYELDKALYIKYSTFWPAVNDPHYQYNQSENSARITYYQNDLAAGIPMLTLEGVKITGSSSANTPTTDEAADYFDATWPTQPGFLIDLDADFSGSNIPVTVTLTALDDVTLADKVLHVVLVQTLIEYDEAPGSEGETEFHYVFRDAADAVDALTDLTAGNIQTITTSLVRDLSWEEDRMVAIAFIQDDADKSILQAGSTGLTETARAALFTSDNPNRSQTTSGGE